MCLVHIPGSFTDVLCSDVEKAFFVLIWKQA